MHKYAVLALVSLAVAYAAGRAPVAAQQAPMHHWNADYTVEYNAPPTPGDEIVDGPRPFTYAWNFGILNDPTGPLGPSRIVVSPASGLGPLQPDIRFGVTYDATSSAPNRIFSVPSLAPLPLTPILPGQPPPPPSGMTQFFGGLRSQLATPVHALGLDAVRSLSGGRHVAPGATEQRTFTLTMTSRDETVNNMQAGINFRPFTPGPPPVSVPSFNCVASAGQPGLSLKPPFHDPNGNVFWDVTSASATEPLPVGATYTLTCTLTVVNNNASGVAEYMPAAHARADRNADAVLTLGDFVELPTSAQGYPADPLGTVRFEVTPAVGEALRARLQTRFARRASFTPVNTLCRGSVRFTVSGVGSGPLQVVADGVDGTETVMLPFGTTEIDGVEPGTYQLTATAPSGLAVTPSAIEAVVACGEVTNVMFTLTDNEPPVLTGGTYRILTSGGGFWRPLIMEPSVDDAIDPHPTCSITSVTPIELPKGGPSLAWIINDATEIGGVPWVAVELSPVPSVGGNGRSYTVVVTCTDASGNSASKSTVFRVRPQDKESAGVW